ncbi:hypothetical protein ACFYO1_01655 [Nocardia sp. NPDC006044]|uniref:hypothetical protein n=1 Tax=Nocardia sp. NPDC006044 TaxID=3364306 RepID=UPI0036C17686
MTRTKGTAMRPLTHRSLFVSMCLGLSFALGPNPIPATADPDPRDGGVDVAPRTDRAGAATVHPPVESAGAMPAEAAAFKRRLDDAVAALKGKLTDAENILNTLQAAEKAKEKFDKALQEFGLGGHWVWDVPGDIAGWLNGLEPPKLAFAPGTADTGHAGVVGLQAWAWFDQAHIRETTVGPRHDVIAKSLLFGAWKTQGTAHLRAVAVNWGDGSLPSVCANPTPWRTAQPFLPYEGGYDLWRQPGQGDTASPSCGHFIGKSSTAEPGGTFEVTAVSIWTVSISHYWFFGVDTPKVYEIPWATLSKYRMRIGEAQALDTVDPGGRR